MDDLEIAVMIDKIAIALRNERKMSNDDIKEYLISEADRVFYEFETEFMSDA